ncbi:MAG: transglycosylase SLT domain-containing protein [Sulfuricurvum sp.]|nr:transglycosylase SLT domain-containing protein [Sulfuricurvum sp.]MDD5387283.1 transglycosylase SLT domain-containing protein [Sulfuricurvum sp.]
MKFLSFLVLFVCASLADNTSNQMSPKQLNVLQTVRDVAKSIPDKHGKTYENTLSAICITESSAGKNTIGDFHNKKSITKASLGPMQVRVSTARHVSQNIKNLSWLNKLSDIQLAARLLGDTRLSAKVAAYYVVLLHNQRNSPFNAVSGYNGGMNNPTYYNKVMKNKAVVAQLVSTGKLS